MRRRNTTKRFFNRVNWQIQATTVRLIDDSGKQVGIVSIQEAREQAKEKGLDLVEIAAKAKPPVVRIVSYSKFKYQQQKKEREERKKLKKGEKSKEIRLTPFIGEADFKTRIARAGDFAKEGDKLKVVVKFLGRQITQKQFGYKLLEKVKEELKDIYEEEGQARLMGKRLLLTLKPIRKVTEKHHEKNEKENTEVSRQQVQDNQKR